MQGSYPWSGAVSLETVCSKRPGQVRTLLQKGMLYARMVKISHTVFALPFALSAVALAWKRHPISPADICWILLAMVGARSAAMGFNRIVDAPFDRRNPRTKNREIPSGKLSLKSAIPFVGLSSAGFVFAALMLGKLCFYLSFPVLAALFFYSFTKRFTRWCHLYLGFAISLAPLGAWIAVTGTFFGPILFLSGALMTYIAGFDIIYACMDVAFDRKQGLFSLPSTLGTHYALRISSVLHITCILFLLAIYPFFNMYSVYLITVLLIAGLFMVEHLLVNPDDLSRIHIAFFHVNTIIALVLFFGILADIWVWEVLL